MLQSMPAVDDPIRTLISELENRMDQPTAKGLATAVSRTVRDGVLRPGDKLPPIRELAHQLAFSPTTVSAAWGLLARAGTLRTDGRRGTVVADVSAPREGRYRQALEHQTGFALDLSTGIPDERLLPGLSRALRAVTTAGTPLSYLDDPVLPELAEVVAASWPYPAPALTVVDGALDALDLVIRTTLRYGDRVVVEHPSFPPLLDLLEAAGADVVGVPMDAEGMLPDALAEAAATPAVAVFLQPRSHNPTGISITPARAAALADVLRGSETLVVEDDSGGAISVAPDVSLGSFLPERTVHIRSYSKSHGPDLRLAAMSGPVEVVGEVRHLRQLGQGWSSRLLQRVLFNLLTDDRTQGDVARARAEYARRRELFVSALSERGIEVGGSDGINLWVPVHDEAAAIMRLASSGIGVAPGAPFSVLPTDQGHVRVTVGLVGRDIESVADVIATAARTGGWGSRAR
jgi:DNA-binding transcriptional MocR family regulator